MLNGTHISVKKKKESSFASQSKEMDVEKVGTAFNEGTLIKSTVKNATKVTNNYAKTIHNEKQVLMKIINVATEKELKEVLLEIEKEYDVVEKVGISEEETLLKYTVEKQLNLNDAKTI